MKNLVRCIVAFALFLAAISAFGQERAYLSIKKGWNLLGNSHGSNINMTAAFGYYGGNDTWIKGVTDNVITVWKWNTYNSRWEFFSPRIDPSYLPTYAAEHGFDVLTDIYPGEGFWVNATSATVIWQDAYPADWITGDWNMGLPPGWKLGASPVAVTPSELVALLTPTPPTPEAVSSVTTLWAWDNAMAKWYFYAPSLAADGVDNLRNYQWQKGYLDFDSTQKKIEVGEGFWANIKPQPQPQVPTVTCGDYCKGATTEGVLAN